MQIKKKEGRFCPPFFCHYEDTEVLEVDGMRICRVLLTRLRTGSDEVSEPEQADRTERADDEQED